MPVQKSSYPPPPSPAWTVEANDQGPRPTKHQIPSSKIWVLDHWDFVGHWPLVIHFPMLFFSVMSELSLHKGALLTEPELDNAVYDLIREALSQGMIPIAGIASQPPARWPTQNPRLRLESSPRRRHPLRHSWRNRRDHEHGPAPKGGYRDDVATSSLSPCPFCQCCLAALHLGIKEIRILDAINYKPDFAGYEKVGLNPVVSNHPKIAALFLQMGAAIQRMRRSGIATSASGIASTPCHLT